jgi:hypothetical protein
MALPLIAVLALLALWTLYWFIASGIVQANVADERAKSRGMARALAFRVGFSIVLFLCILLAWKLGYIHPTGIAPGR